MCGIAGFAGEFPESLLGEMNALLAHRGPDDSGTYVVEGEGVGLTHRRLSIIDLSPRGHQPMWDATGTVVIVFNGEIFNYREWRTRLRADGYEFHSDSDTEVILNLYLKYGDGVLSRLNGMFAFALWDSRDKTLLLARDGVGVKPLYYGETKQGVLFASELKALLCSPAVERSLDYQAINSYLTHLWCPAPRTMLSSVKKLEPGNALRVKNGQVVRRWIFYDLPYDQAITPMTTEEAAAEVRSHIKTAVERQMVADVPIGALLSGGLDSSSVVAFAKQAQPESQFKCFTIGFNDESFAREGSAEDLPYAQRVAKHLGVDLETIYVGPEMASEIERMVYHLDEPQADLAPLNAYLICKLAREHDIKVLLSGAGGDDIFTGYRRHSALNWEAGWNWMPHMARRALRKGAKRLRSSSAFTRRISKAFSYADLDGDARVASYFNWIDPDFLQSLYAADMAEAIVGGAAESPLVQSLSHLPQDVSPLNRMLYLDGKHFLADHNLNYFDKMSMATGVEVRVPLLDPDLIALAARMPVSYKQHRGSGKWIFKLAMEQDLPRDVIYRPKSGFGVPLRHWLRNELRFLVEDSLSEETLKRRNLFDPGAIREMLDLDRTGRIDAAYTILSMLCIELWCRMFLDVPKPRGPS